MLQRAATAVTSSHRLNNFYGTLVSKALRRKSVADTLCTTFNADEVVPGVYVGDVYAAHNVGELKKRNITHIVSAVMGVVPAFPEEFKYLHVQLIDCASESVLVHFNLTCNFIEEALAGGNKVLVHCMRGISRSATIAAAFVMYQRGVSSQEAVAMLQAIRPVVCPNYGFLMQLQWYEKILLEQKSNTIITNKTEEETFLNNNEDELLVNKQIIVEV